MTLNKRHLPFWLLIVSLFFILIIRDLFRDGMFMDGMLYSTVAHNLANGLGSFWHPYFSQTVMPDFHEQPPLLFGIEALFFKVFGSSLYVERIYGLFITLISMFLITKLWKFFFTDKPEKELGWLALLFWFSIPVCCWSYVNNVEEPTMGMFDLGAILFISKSFIQNNKTWLNLSIAALMLIAASLCKGIQGLFPLAAIFFYWAVFRKISFSRMLAQSAFLTTIIIAFYGIILLNETVRSSYVMYIHNRITPAFTDPGITHPNRFGILLRLFQELIPAFVLVIAGGIFFGIKKKYTAIDKNSLRISLWFLLIALSGTLPLMSTKVQSGFYFVMALPYFAIAFACLFAPSLSTIIGQINTTSKKFKIYTTGIWLILAASVVFSIVTVLYIPKRDKEMLHDVYCTASIISKGSIISIPVEIYNEWSLQTYYNRYFFISLDASAKRHKYFLFKKELDPKLIPAGYILVNLPTQRYDLYIRNSQ
jgi:hypothetical protein